MGGPLGGGPERSLWSGKKPSRKLIRAIITTRMAGGRLGQIWDLEQRLRVWSHKPARPQTPTSRTEGPQSLQDSARAWVRDRPTVPLTRARCKGKGPGRYSARARTCQLLTPSVDERGRSCNGKPRHREMLLVLATARLVLAYPPYAGKAQTRLHTAERTT